MLDTKQFISAIQQIAEEKNIPKDKVVETIEAAIAAAYKKDYGQKGQVIRARLDKETGDVSISQIKYVIEGVDADECVIGPLPDSTLREERTEGSVTDTGQIIGADEEKVCVKFNPEKFITLEDVKLIDPSLNISDELVISLEPKMDFGRIAAQTAKQVIVQRLREIEREAIFAEFKSREGQVVSGTVQRMEGRVIYIDLGRTTGILMAIEQLPNDHYRIGQRLRFLLVRVEETSKGPVIFLSRTHPRFVIKLFEFEVPEIESGTVEIKSIAREPGSRSKVAVISHESAVDPIGSLVGQKGVRVQTVINELAGEKIDIIEWNEDAKTFISNALSPAKILLVKIMDEQFKHALVEVADDQFSLAIGKNGQNVRLAAKLTGWKIDVRAPRSELRSDEDSTIKQEKLPVESVKQVATE